MSLAAGLRWPCHCQPLSAKLRKMISTIPETRDVFLPQSLFGPSWPGPLMPATQESGWTGVCGLALTRGARNAVWEHNSPPLCSHPLTTQASLSQASYHLAIWQTLWVLAWAVMLDKDWRLLKATQEIQKTLPACSSRPASLCCDPNREFTEDKSIFSSPNPKVFSKLYKCTIRSVHLCGTAKVRVTTLKYCLTAHSNTTALSQSTQRPPPNSKSKLEGNFRSKPQ